MSKDAVRQRHEAAMLFALKGQQRRAGRKYAGRNRRKMSRSNVKYARRPAGWREWVQWLAGKRFKYHSNPLPVFLRPHVPHVYERLEQGDAALRDAIYRACTKRQWAHLCSVYPVLGVGDAS